MWNVIPKVVVSFRIIIFFFFHMHCIEFRWQQFFGYKRNVTSRYIEYKSTLIYINGKSPQEYCKRMGGGEREEDSWFAMHNAYTFEISKICSHSNELKKIFISTIKSSKNIIISNRRMISSSLGNDEIKSITISSSSPYTSHMN